MLYRRGEETAVVITCEDDDELFYLLDKLKRTRVKWLKKFASDMLVDFFEKISGSENYPEAKVVSSD